MSDIPFFKTLMGHKFFERDIPALIKHLATIGTNLERIGKALDRLVPPAPASDE